MNDMAGAVAAARGHFIDGQWVGADGPTFPDHNPYNDALIAEIAAGGRAEAEAAVAAAEAAFPAWASLGPGERQRLFLKAADIVDARLEDAVRLMAIEGAARAALSPPSRSSSPPRCSVRRQAGVISLTAT